MIEVLESKGITDFEEHEYWNRQYWRSHVRSVPPGGATLAINIREIHKLIKSEKEFEKYLTLALLQWFETFTDLAKCGHYEPPSDTPLFAITEYDADGLPVYASLTGTNHNELVHRKYYDLIGSYAVGVMTAHHLSVL